MDRYNVSTKSGEFRVHRNLYKEEYIIIGVMLLFAYVLIDVYQPYVVKWTHCASDFGNGELYLDDNYNCMNAPFIYAVIYLLSLIPGDIYFYWMILIQIINAIILYTIMRYTNRPYFGCVLYVMTCSFMNLQFMFGNLLFAMMIYYFRDRMYIPAALLAFIKPVYLIFVFFFFIFLWIKKLTDWKQLFLTFSLIVFLYIPILAYGERLMFGHLYSEVIDISVITVFPTIIVLLASLFGGPIGGVIGWTYIPLVLISVFRVNRYLWIFVFPALLALIDHWNGKLFITEKKHQDYILYAVFFIVILSLVTEIMEYNKYAGSYEMSLDIMNMLPLEDDYNIAGNWWEVIRLNKYTPDQAVPPTELYYARFFQRESFINETSAYILRKSPDVILFSPVDLKNNDVYEIAKEISSEYYTVVVPFPYDFGYRLFLTKNLTEAINLREDLRQYFNNKDICEYPEYFQFIVSKGLGVDNKCTVSTF